MSDRRRVVIGCRPDPKDPDRQTRHRRWVWVDGIYSTAEHPYIEEQCNRCGAYRSEVLAEPWDEGGRT